MADVEALGGRIRQLRRERGLSQRELGGDELSPSYVSLVEAGKRRPSAEAVALMAERLGTSPRGLTEDLDGEVLPRTRAEVDLDLKWARIAIRAGNPASAEKYARLVLDDVGVDESERLDALSLLAAATEGQGDLVGAIAIGEDLATQLDPDVTRELWLSTQVMLLRCYKDAGDMDLAIDLGERAMRLIGPTVREEEMMLTVSLADAYAARGDLTRASMLLQNVTRRAEDTGSLQVRGGALWNASLVAADDGRIDDAVRLSEQALAVFSESDAVRNLARLHASCGVVQLELASPDGVDRAREHFQAAVDGLDLEGTTGERARILVHLAQCDVAAGDVDAADLRLAEAHQLLDEIGESAVSARATAHLVQAHVLVLRGRAAEAMTLAREAAVATDRVDTRREASRTWRAVAELARQVGDVELRMEALEASVDAAGVRAAQGGIVPGARPASPTRETDRADRADRADERSPGVTLSLR
ncbi:helix-turn-helix domain-containing protein [Solicola sp. PLA-1-18]|uniref:helix-turn-helix domain-containing protein n=1 Tax=Solicola sp. PLA-1-18 TaxID=3380532 RepID=UPI003B7B3402